MSGSVCWFNGAAITTTAAGSAGQILTSNGTGAPTWASAGGIGFTQIVQQVFTSNGTYTPTAGMKYCVVEMLGGGGAGGGCAAVSGNNQSVGAGGGAGEYARAVFTASTIGSVQSVTIGSAGSA